MILVEGKIIVLGFLAFLFSIFNSIAHATPTLGLHVNGELGIPPVLALISEAKKSIDIAIYEMDDRTVRQALREALARGVQVRVLQDPAPVGGCKVFTSSSSSEDCRDQQRLVAEVRRSRGSEYVPFNRPTLCGTTPGGGREGCFLHAKALLMDRGTPQALALLSSGNFNSSSICDKDGYPDLKTCNRDYSYVTDDPSVLSALVQIYEKDLNGRAYALEPILARVTGKLTASPFSLQPLLDFIASARSRIQIQNQYITDPSLRNALIQVQARGVRVELMVASLCAYSKPYGRELEKDKEDYGPYLDAGVGLKFFTKNEKVNGIGGYLHAKAIVVDGTRAWVGSVNGSQESLERNRELGVFFSDPKDVKKLSDQMGADFTHPGAATIEESLACAKDGGM